MLNCPKCHSRMGAGKIGDGFLLQYYCPVCGYIEQYIREIHSKFNKYDLELPEIMKSISLKEIGLNGNSEVAQFFLGLNLDKLYDVIQQGSLHVELHGGLPFGKGAKLCVILINHVLVYIEDRVLAEKITEYILLTTNDNKYLCDASYNTPLRYVTRPDNFCNLQIAELLLTYGADPSAPLDFTSDSELLLDALISCPELENEYGIKLFFEKEKMFIAMIQLLQKYGGITSSEKASEEF